MQMKRVDEKYISVVWRGSFARDVSRTQLQSEYIPASSRTRWATKARGGGKVKVPEGQTRN